MTVGTHLPSWGRMTTVRAMPEGWVRWHVHCACRWTVLRPALPRDLEAYGVLAQEVGGGALMALWLPPRG